MNAYDWRPELEVVMDEAIERGRMREVSDKECGAALFIGSMGCGTFHREEIGSGYDWAGIGDVAETNGLWLHRDCPLWGCEYFVGQEFVPVHGVDNTLYFRGNPVGVARIHGLQPRQQHFRLVPQVDTPQTREWARQVEALLRPALERQIQVYQDRLIFGAGLPR